MLKRFEQALQLRPDEWKLALPAMLLLAVNTLVLELADVVAMAGFISNVGPTQLLWLWPVGMALTVVAAGGYALVVDRTQRVKLIGRLLLGFGALYVGMLLLFAFGAPDWLTYPLLSILSEQQYAVFPLAFWALANDLYSVSDSKRLFPVLGAGAALGSLIGNGLAGLAATWFESRAGGSTWQILVVCATLCFAGWLTVRLVFRNQTMRARQSKHDERDIREVLRVGMDVIRNVPLFSYLAVALFAAGLALTVVEFHFLVSLDEIAADNPLQLQRIYGFYKVGLVIATLLFQWSVANRWLGKINPKSSFVVLPAVLLLAGAGALIAPLVGGLGGRFLARLFQSGWDEPARKSVQGIVPDERRGRVSVFLDSYCYAFATIMGCALLGLVILARSLGWIDADAATIIYLALAVVAAGSALWSALRIRTVYDKSLLNWRLSRSRRRSVLDGIEF